MYLTWSWGPTNLVCPWDGEVFFFSLGWGDLLWCLEDLGARRIMLQRHLEFVRMEEVVSGREEAIGGMAPPAVAP